MRPRKTLSGSVGEGRHVPAIVRATLHGTGTNVAEVSGCGAPPARPGHGGWNDGLLQKGVGSIGTPFLSPRSRAKMRDAA